jgi:hypothetical protein
MQITRNPEREQYLFGQIRKSFAILDIERNKHIHLTDLMTPRQAYWKRVMPLPLEEREIQYFIIGRGHEDVFHRVTGLSKLEGKVWEGICYSMDFFAPPLEPNIFPVGSRPTEMKTRRGYLAKEGEELERYSNYLIQLKGYSAVEWILVGELWIFSLVEKTDAYRTEPQLACYEVQFSEEELHIERDRLRTTHKALLYALTGVAETPWMPLPSCEEWMCRRTITNMIEKPRCIDCDREFETDYGAGLHQKGKKTLGHKIKPAVYEKTYEPRCKWYRWCMGGEPLPIVGKEGNESAFEA